VKTLVVAAAAFAAAGGIAYASIPDAGGTYHACMLKGIGTIRIIDTDKQRCNTALETEITFNQKGQDGLNGVSPTVAQVDPGGACANGGAAITDAAGHTAYVCNGADGAKGDPGEPFSGTFTSPSGAYSLTVDDTGVTIAHGTDTIKLVDDDVTVHVHGGIRFEGDSLSSMIGHDVDLRAGTNLTLRASSNFDLRANGQGNVQSSNTLSLGGSMVNVNGCTAPAARIGDQVVGVADPQGSVFAHILTGSPTVCIG